MARDWWQRGRGLDLWSIPHFLFGVLTGMLSPLIGMPLLAALALTLILALLWELYEKLVGIRETILNILFDITLPVVAFTLTSLTLIAYPPYPDDLIVAAVAVSLVFAFTNISGWRAYRRRNRNFMR
jgi:hypothetical protein